MHPQVPGLDHQCSLVIGSERSAKGSDQAQGIFSFCHAARIENEKKERMALRYPKKRPIERNDLPDLDARSQLHDGNLEDLPQGVADEAERSPNLIE